MNHERLIKWLERFIKTYNIYPERMHSSWSLQFYKTLSISVCVTRMLQFWFGVGRAQSIVLQRLFADLDNDESLAWASLLLSLLDPFCVRNPLKLENWPAARRVSALGVCIMAHSCALALSVKGYQVVGRVSLPVSFALIKKPSTTCRDTFSGVCTHPLTPAAAANLFNNASLLTMIT